MAIGNISDEITSEKRSLLILRKLGFQYIQQLDWIAKEENTWVAFEIKDKELFTPGTNYPHYGAGLDQRQRYLREQLYKELGIRTYLLVFAKGTTDIYGGYLDELDSKNDYYDSPNDIRIYPIRNFTRYIWLEP